MAHAVLCGSLNLESRDEVFRTVASIAGTSVKRISDGETDERKMWTDAQVPRFAAAAQLAPAGGEHETSGKPSFRLKEGADPGALRLDFGYAAAAIDSFRAFAALKDEGVIPAGTRFQVSMPSSVGLGMYIDPSDVEAVLPAIERGLIEQARVIAEAIPHDQLAIQWDLAAEMAVAEGLMPIAFIDGLGELADVVVPLAAAVPDDVELGFHLCYGDEPDEGGQGQHFIQPADTSMLVAFANQLTQRVPRPIGWIHMPVPIARDDDAYFAPLAGLRLAPGTELYLGLVHHEDGVEGAQRRVDAAARHVTGFGVATECGMGREAREVVPQLLRIQAEVRTPA